MGFCRTHTPLCFERRRVDNIEVGSKPGFGPGCDASRRGGGRWLKTELLSSVKFTIFLCTTHVTNRVLFLLICNTLFLYHKCVKSTQTTRVPKSPVCAHAHSDPKFVLVLRDVCCAPFLATGASCTRVSTALHCTAQSTALIG